MKIQYIKIVFSEKTNLLEYILGMYDIEEAEIKCIGHNNRVSFQSIILNQNT